MYTGNVSKAGTDANVYLSIYGEKADTDEIHLSHSKTHSNKFERNNVHLRLNIFKYESEY